MKWIHKDISLLLLLVAKVSRKAGGEKERRVHLWAKLGKEAYSLTQIKFYYRISFLGCEGNTSTKPPLSAETVQCSKTGAAPVHIVPV